ncbi:3-hydroxy-9,10-secoandrosta-1,3,5(10)-triene-9,17-dione monooxygenase reductase subunit [Crossiella cryophila]|uniref:3-hydroxy-9,10-secoandrosta-1,3,5(10)-triene-9, 17-dione monooxygenase reductase component n=1 Tax=Crossiella cryophila TaxID=43355 RepID=A0A7W7CGX7_9PSEU|nr:3-hydroxy-9,10-secoandrosta-1,3,5(10)-triene-9,17-dione monooxygenase reductase subunit [Crossiella cryophila]MBB4681040.1 3-hydroxy-9,10-secoandrosta-1,3,5(10)-triene-9,17-dione monooxygenase reductase component [Crossiella cryophila]
MTVDSGLTADRFRAVLGHFCTGVAVVTAPGPVGFACQSFAALSLDPPLVLFCAGHTSRSLPLIRQAGVFAVNMLAEDQQGLSTVFGRSGPDKFAGVDWNPAGSGSPLLAGVLTWADCELRAEHDAGDHVIVVGEVRELGPVSERRPLLFYRGRYAATDGGGESPGHLDSLFTWSRPTDWM